MVTKLETLGTSAAKLRIEVLYDLEAAQSDWRALFACAPASAYQAYDYAKAWFSTIGRAQGVAPVVVVLRDASREAQALLPLGVRNLAGLRVAEFAGGRESNFGLALIRPGATVDFREALAAAGRSIKPAIDFFYLRHQPLRMNGEDNPLATLRSAPSPSFAYGVALPSNLQAFDGRLSGKARKKLRHKERRLAAEGEVVFEHRAQGASGKEILAALGAQKAARLVSLGVKAGGGFASPATADFLQQLLDAGLLETHALRLSGRIVATYVGLAHRGRYSTFANSFDMSEDIARSSPGEALLHALLRDCVSRGFDYFDLGVGEARYKDAVCDETIELYDSVVAVTLRGVAAAIALRVFLFAKRFAKQTPAIAQLFAKARRNLRR